MLRTVGYFFGRSSKYGSRVIIICPQYKSPGARVRRPALGPAVVPFGDGTDQWQIAEYGANFIPGVHLTHDSDR
jgi:hypothetical protein